MAERDIVNEFLNEASKTAEARVNIIRTLWDYLGDDKKAMARRSLCVYDQGILNSDLKDEG